MREVAMRTVVVVPLLLTALLCRSATGATSANNARRSTTTPAEDLLVDDLWSDDEKGENEDKDIEYEVDSDYDLQGDDEEDDDDDDDDDDAAETSKDRDLRKNKEIETFNNEGRTIIEGCTVDIRQDVADHEPLILQKKCGRDKCQWKLSEGDEDFLYFQRGEEILIACTGNNNKLVNIASQPTSIVALCSSKKNNIFEVNGKEYPVKDFACTRTSKGDVVNKSKTCGPRNAELLEIGFSVRDQWYSLINVCYVKSRADTLYTEHILQGESDKPRRHSKRPSFEEGGQYKEFSVNDAYKNSNRTLQELTGYTKYPSSIPSAIDRGHLSPLADFPITPYRYTTYFYVNTVPMWSVVNRGNWATLEDKIRKVARNLKVDFYVTTGIFRVMNLTDINGNKKEFFLYTTSTRKALPVPKFLWKVVYDENSQKGIAFVILHDPFKKEIDSSDQLCPNVCKSYGWNDRRWDVISKGVLYCCEVKELKKSISYLPKYDIRSVLRGPD